MKEEYGEINATWLGHACFLIDLPFIGSLGRDARVLFDRAFGDRCSPSQFLGPKRIYHGWMDSSFRLFVTTRIPKPHAHALDSSESRRVEIPGTSLTDKQWFQTPWPS
ncbi:hypothetical protein ARMGADRAFT_1084837 [Armillaria gallica]|uniref:Uncharacterized protein n=1 Tax=Armillaria gallica TaxID=47427 RepID=A0A2H3DBE3_ARMGA|nr:hypothetical protein ARMGADRAFT_1084837 [Armillaria gallica]